MHLVFTAASQGLLLDQGDLHFCVPRHCDNQRQFLASCHIQDTVQIAGWGTLPCLSVKEASMLVLELQPEGQASGLVHLWWTAKLLSRNLGCGYYHGTLYCLNLAHQYLPEKSSHTHLFCNCHPGDTARLPGKWNLHLWSHRLYIFAYY